LPGLRHADAIGPALRAADYGTLVYNFRGQADSTFTPNTDLGPATIVADLKRIVDHVGPPRPYAE
jgi:hypothetical protein